MNIEKRLFGRFWNTPVHSFVLTNKNGMEVEVLEYGATIRRLVVPGKNGPADVVLGFDTLAEYVAGCPYFGCTVGRVANRIGGGTLLVEGKPYVLSANEGRRHHLHGGVRGFDKYVWDAEHSHGVARVCLSRTSLHGEEGYPGTLHVEHDIELDEDNGLSLRYTLTALQGNTVANVTNHSYYNLGGHHCGNATPHELQIFADAVTPTDGELIPTGCFLPVAETLWDFTTPRHVGERMAVQPGATYDINYVLRKADPAEGDLFAAATLHHPESGRTLRVATDLPGIQFYNSAGLEPCLGKQGASYGPFSGLCLETQYFPDSPHHGAFPSIEIVEGEKRQCRTVFRFEWR